MAKENLVSVVMPLFNSESFLEDSINSVLNQTYPDTELVIIDDGSTDKSPELLKQFKNEAKIISKKNSGLWDSLRLGVENTSGEFFKWLSPDDILVPKAIEMLVTESQKIPKNSILYSNWELIDDKEKSLGFFSESNYNTLTNQEFNIRLLDHQLINVNTSLIPTSLFEKGCIFQNLQDPVGIDYDFFLRAGILFDVNFHLIEFPLLKYRVHSSQLSRKKIVKTLDFLEEIRSDILMNLNEETKNQYLESLKNYQKNQPLFKRSLKTGLNVMTSLFPDWVTDPLLVFYVNKLRRTR